MPRIRSVKSAVALLEVHSLGAALVVLDGVEKSAQVRILQAELNDNYGLLLKLAGDSSSVRVAVETARRVTVKMVVSLTATVLDLPDTDTWKIIECTPEFQPLLGREVVLFPDHQHSSMSNQHTAAEALGLIETQGFVAITAAIDAACKAAGIRLIAKEKLGGGYITVIFEGDVAAVAAAVEAGRQAAEPMGKLISACVIARPCEDVRRILSRI